MPITKMNVHLPPNFHAYLLRFVGAYVDSFITLEQVRPAYQLRVRNHVLLSIDQVFFPNSLGKTTWQEPNSLNKIIKGYIYWTSWKRFLRCILNTLDLTTLLPSSQLTKFCKALAYFPPTQSRISWQKWSRLVGILRIIAPALSVGGLFLSTSKQLLAVETAISTSIYRFTQIYRIEGTL